MALKSYIKKLPFSGYFYRFIKKKKSRLKYYLNRILLSCFDYEYLLKQFPKIGIQPGDAIVVSSSLSSLGHIDGGAETFVKALQEYITFDGLIVMPTYPHTNMFQYLESDPIFHIMKTPSQNGIISEVFRKSENVFRSLHPTHCIAAWGRKASELVAGHEKSTSPYDTKSPYKKLMDLNAKTLLIGVNLNHAIMIRAIDDLYSDYPLSPYIKKKVYEVITIDKTGNKAKVSTPCHDPQFSKERNNMVVFSYLKDKIVFGKLGRARTMVFYSQDLFNTQIQLSKKGVFPFHKLPLKNRI